MLSHSGGIILFGVSPEGEVVGQHVSDQTIQKVSAEIQRIDPPAFPTLERVVLAVDCEVVMVRVSQGPVKPYA